jgi:hypothetical protein
LLLLQLLMLLLLDLQTQRPDFLFQLCNLSLLVTGKG